MNKAMHNVAHRPGASGFRRLAFLLCAAGSAFVFGRLTAGSSSADPAAVPGLGLTSDSPQTNDPNQPAANAFALANLVRGAQASAETGGAASKPEHAQSPHPEQQAQLLLDRLTRVLPDEPDTPISSALQIQQAEWVAPYARGMADAMRNGDPALLSELADQTTDRLCDKSLTRNQATVLAQLGKHLPEVVTTTGMQCFLKSTQGKEDPNLWSMLDAWTDNGQPPLPEIAELAKVAVDSRTTTRLLAPEQAAQVANDEFAVQQQPAGPNEAALNALRPSTNGSREQSRPRAARN